MKLDEGWIRAHLPPEVRDEPIDCFHEEYLDGLTVMAKGERGGPDFVVYQAKDPEDLRWWQLAQISMFLGKADHSKTWRWYRDHAADGKWFYKERHRYDYNAIEDPRLPGFECYLRILNYAFPKDRLEQEIQAHIRLMNYWYKTPHWDYDRERLCFVEVSDSKEHDGDGIEEPRPGSVVGYLDEPEPEAAQPQEAETAAKYSEQDLKLAAEFREGVHADALAILRRTRPGVTGVIDRHPVEDYFQQHWDYPGKWYTVVAIPEGFRSREALVQTIVRDTLAYRHTLAALEADPGRGLPDRSGEHPDPGPGTESRDPGNRDPGPEADPFDALIAEYPDLAIDYCIVEGCGYDTMTGSPLSYQGAASHRLALSRACRRLLAPKGWRYDLSGAKERKIDAGELFRSNYREGKLNYRRAFLYPPHGNGCTGLDFVRVNAALFPQGTDGLEVCEWTTGWSDYFDEGREWWGTLCLTVYDPHLDRFAVILASATD